MRLLMYKVSMAASLIFKVVYGREVEDIHDPLVKCADELMKTTEYAGTGGWIVDFVPFCKS